MPRLLFVTLAKLWAQWAIREAATLARAVVIPARPVAILLERLAIPVGGQGSSIVGGDGGMPNFALTPFRSSCLWE